MRSLFLLIVLFWPAEGVQGPVVALPSSDSPSQFARAPVLLISVRYRQDVLDRIVRPPTLLTATAEAGPGPRPGSLRLPGSAPSPSQGGTRLLYLLMSLQR